MHLAVHSIKQREGESVRAFATRNLVEHLSIDLPSTYNGLMEKTYTWIKAREVTSNGAPNDRRDNFERSRKSSWDNGRGKRSRDSRRSRDMSKFRYFHEVHRHDTNDCRQLRSQIEEAMRKDNNAENGNEGVKKVRETSLANTEGVLNCSDAEEKIIINSKYPEQTVTIGKQLPEHFKESTAARKEVEELTRARILREAIHQTWVANPVMVKKSDGGWRMCVDFTDINKACPKDCYSLPKIDWKVESLLGFCLKCFLDAYKGYHHIQIAEEDEDKTAFFAGEGVYCYRKMPFGLKNTGATYQRLVDKVFNDQIGRNLEAYVDDMVIKSTLEEDMLADIKETFQRF
ncbi:reverse transcriptase domain-containing protein [Tanacetum coccineum]